MTQLNYNHYLNSTKKLKKSLLTLLIVCFAFQANLIFGNNYEQNTPDTASNYISNEQDSTLYRSHKDKSDLRTQFERGYQVSLDKKDTLNTIINLIELSDLDRWKGNYETAFDRLWMALLLSKETKQENKEIRILRNLGILYEIYHQDSLALLHLNTSLTIAKKLYSQKKVNVGQVVQSYFSISTIHRNNGDYDQAMLYLDSCELIYGDNRYMPFVQADKGLLHLLKGDYSIAREKLFKSNRYFAHKNDRYQIMMLYYLGDLMMATNKADSALYYYEKSLAVMQYKPAHLDIQPQLLKKLADLYFQQKKYPQAYQYLNLSKQVSDSLFSATHDRNKQLFGIKNKYLETIKEKEALIESKNEEIESKDSIVLQLWIAIATVTLLGIFIFISLRFRAKIKEVRLKQDLENQQNKTVLELKNKELTTYALKMMEKERAVAELLDIIKKGEKVNHASLYNKHVTNSDNLWEDFNLRFIELNDGFYEILKTKHPDLTPTEQKHCALIKLDFNNHEMAQLLNISLQSVHTSRYRIRKKLNLDKEESLSAYIYSL